MSDWEILHTYPTGYHMYKIDPTIAQRIKELRLGLGVENRHSWRALSIRITGFECQMTGKDLCQAAMLTLGENWNE